MNNKTINGVPRELLQNLLHCGDTASTITPYVTARVRELLAAPDPIVEADGIGEPVAQVVNHQSRDLLKVTVQNVKLLRSVPDGTKLYSADQLAALQSTIAQLKAENESLLELKQLLTLLREIHGFESWASVLVEVDKLKAENERLRGDKARIDFWQDHPQYIGGFSPSGNWSFFNRGSKTCYGEDLRDALDQMQTMDAELEVRRMNS